MPKEGFEIIFHARAGQGAKTAAQIVAEVALELGYHIHAFPYYGPERSGAPMKSFVRISKTKITNFSPITDADFTIVIDPSFIYQFDITKNLSKNGILILNTNRDINAIKKYTKFKKIALLNATKISLEELGINKPNTPMLGALAKLSETIPFKEITNKIRSSFLEKKGEEIANKNTNAVKRGYDEVILHET